MKARKRTKKTESLQSRRSAQGDRRRSTLTAGRRGARACAGGDCLWWHRLQSQADALASTCLRRHFPQTHPQRRTVTSISFLLLPQTSHQSVALTAQKWVSKGLGTDRDRTVGQRAARVTDSGFRGSAQRGLCFPASPPQLFRPHLSVPSPRGCGQASWWQAAVGTAVSLGRPCPEPGACDQVTVHRKRALWLRLG